MTDERDYMPEFEGEEQETDLNMDFSYEEEPVEEVPPVRVAPRDRKPAPPRKKKSPPPAPKKKKGHFGRFVLIYTLVFLIIGAVGLGVLYKWLDAYEQSRPQHVMDAFMEGRSEEDWLNTMLSTNPLEVTGFENGEEIVRAYFEASCRGAEFTYREAAGVSEKDAPVFTVKAGAADVCRVTLRPTDSVGFGFNLWTVDKCEAYISPYSLRSATVEIEAPSDETVSLNGVPLTDLYMVEDNIPCENLGALESRYAEKPYRVRYAVEGLYGDITVTDGSGAVVSPESSEGSIVYKLGGEGGYSFTVTAPEGVKVNVCGTELGEGEVVRRDNGILTGLEAWVSADSGAVTYSAEGLYLRPVITATPPEGRSLRQSDADDGSVIFTYAGEESAKAEYESVVQSYFDTFMSYTSGRDAAFLPLMNATLQGTELYSYIQNSTAAMYWASATTVDYEYLNFEDFIAWTEDCFSCRVSYKAHLTAESWYEVRESDMENVYDMVFIRQGELWYAAVMNFAE